METNLSNLIDQLDAANEPLSPTVMAAAPTAIPPALIQLLLAYGLPLAREGLLALKAKIEAQPVKKPFQRRLVLAFIDMALAALPA